MITTKWFYGNAEQFKDAFYIRKVVFMDEQGFSEKEEFDGTDDEALHLVVYEANDPIATGRIITIDGKCFLGRIAVLEEKRRKYYGDLVVRMLIRRAFIMGAGKQYANAQTRAKGFYKKLGFIEIGEVFDDGGVEHIQMEHEGDIVGDC